MRTRWILLGIGLVALATAMPAAERPAVVPAAPPVTPAIQAVELDTAYVAAGGVVHGRVRLDVPSQNLRVAASLCVTALRDADVVDGKKPAGRRTEELLTKPVSAGMTEVKFDLATGDMLVGTMQVRAELVAGRDAPALAAAWSAPVRVGVRKRIDLGGEWTVAGVKIWEGDVPQRPKDWKPQPPPATVAVPGRFPFDEGWRGWITLKREAAWKKDGDLAPRAVMVYGASDSAKVRVAGADLGETTPIEDVAALTHWLEFHCPYKGPENQEKRLLITTGGTEYPVEMTLPKALPAEGKAEVEMTVRAVSGGMMGHEKPPYGILNGIYLDEMPGVWLKSVAFDTEKPGDKRRFTFELAVGNDTGKEWKGTLRAVYGTYQGPMPYTGVCPAADSADQPVTIPAGGGKVLVARDEVPRFATCRATFLLVQGGKVLDALSEDYHTMTVEVRDRRDLYLNNERFIYKAHGSWAEDATSRLGMRIKGSNGFRGHGSIGSWRVPGFRSEAAAIDDRYKDGLLTSAGSALLASCEKCTFYDPKDTSNITKAVKGWVRRLGACPGLIDWEATNELHGEPEEARVAILEAFHKFDPYHRPVLATKASGEWEAEAHEGRVAGVDIVGCQYLLTKEAVDSVTAAITEQPLWSTEVNYNDAQLYNDRKMYEVWLAGGLSGSLLFDYGGGGLDQPAPMVSPDTADRSFPGYIFREAERALYQDVTAVAARQADGSVLVTVGNRMPYTLRGPVLAVRGFGTLKARDFAPGDAVTITIPAAQAPSAKERVVVRAEFTTHGGLKCFQIVAPRIVAAGTEGGRK